VNLAHRYPRTITWVGWCLIVGGIVRSIL